jgi:hypothetical protein
MSGGPDRPDRRRREERRAEERRADLGKLPVPVESPAETPKAAGTAATPRPAAAGPDAVFTAQLLAGAPKRGLKGGPETMERARSTYLGAEYSGANDRRPRKGRITKTEI